MKSEALEEIKAALQAQQPEPEPEETTDEVIEDEETTEGTEAEDEQKAEEVEETAEETDEATDEPDEVPDHYTIKTLAEAIEMDIKDFYEVQVPMENGEKIPLGEMKNKYQEQTRQLEKLEAQTKEQPLPGAPVGQEEVAVMVELQAIQNEFDAKDWAELEEIEPGQAALERQKLQDRQQAAMMKYNQIGQVRQEAHNEMLQAAEQKLSELIPAWSDVDVRRADEALISEAMVKAGYTQDMVNSVTDPIAWSLMQELVTLRKEKEKGAKVLKKVSKAPKVLGSKGAAIKPKKGEVAKQLAQKAHLTKNRKDEEAAVKAILSGL